MGYNTDPRNTVTEQRLEARIQELDEKIKAEEERHARVVQELEEEKKAYSLVLEKEQQRADASPAPTSEADPEADYPSRGHHIAAILNRDAGQEFDSLEIAKAIASQDQGITEALQNNERDAAHMVTDAIYQHNQYYGGIIKKGRGKGRRNVYWVEPGTDIDTSKSKTSRRGPGFDKPTLRDVVGECLKRLDRFESVELFEAAKEIDPEIKKPSVYAELSRRKKEGYVTQIERGVYRSNLRVDGEQEAESSISSSLDDHRCGAEANSATTGGENETSETGNPKSTEIPF